MGRGDFSKIPNGMPGIEQPGRPAAPGRGGRRTVARPVGRGELDHARRGCSASTRAREPSRPASDADIVVYDPALRHVLSVQTHHMAVDYFRL